MVTTRQALNRALTEARRVVSSNVMAVCAHCHGSLFPYGHWVKRDGLYYCNTQCADRIYLPEV